MSAIIFHNLRQAEGALAAAAELDRPVTLLTAPGAAAYGGPGYYLAMVRAAQARQPKAAVRAILDCGDDGALAQMAMSLGWRRLVLRGRAVVRAKVRQIAKAHGGEVLARPPRAWDPGADQIDIAAQCRVLLARDARRRGH
jgi:hypothetical protein